MDASKHHQDELVEHAAGARSSSDATTTRPIEPERVRSRLDIGRQRTSILVAVNGRASGWKALDWAAAEAGARGSPLRVVHVVHWPLPTLNPVSGAAPDWHGLDAQERGTSILGEAARRAGLIAPEIAVSTHLEVGGIASAILQAGRDDALIVVGRGRYRSVGFRPASWPIVRGASGPVAVVELTGVRTRGMSAGRVVVGIDGSDGPQPALTHAFQAARRRGVGLTVIHACVWPAHRSIGRGPGIDELRRHADIDTTLQRYRDAFPSVDVRRRCVSGAAGPALVAESAAAALVVVGSHSHSRLHHAVFSSVAHTVFRWAECPIAIVRTPTQNASRDK